MKRWKSRFNIVSNVTKEIQKFFLQHYFVCKSHLNIGNNILVLIHWPCKIFRQFFLANMFMLKSIISVCLCGLQNLCWNSTRWLHRFFTKMHKKKIKQNKSKKCVTKMPHYFSTRLEFYKLSYLDDRRTQAPPKLSSFSAHGKPNLKKKLPFLLLNWFNRPISQFWHRLNYKFQNSFRSCLLVNIYPSL